MPGDRRYRFGARRGAAASAREGADRPLLAENDRIAAANRADFADAGLWSVNVKSSPGAGKTMLLKRTLVAPGERVRIGVLALVVGMVVRSLPDIARYLKFGEM